MTPRQYHVGVLLAQGHSLRCIAAQLHIAERTVRGHIQNFCLALRAEGYSDVQAWWRGQPQWQHTASAGDECPFCEALQARIADLEQLCAEHGLGG